MEEKRNIPAEGEPVTPEAPTMEPPVTDAPAPDLNTGPATPQEQDGITPAAPGDVAEVRIVKPMKGYAFGKLEKLLAPGPGRVKQDCPVAGPCGGCGP